MNDLETSLFTWGEKQQIWQRDLLRKLAQGEMITATDYRSYADEAERVELAKPAPWSSTPVLKSSQRCIPLNATHLQTTASESSPGTN